MAEQISLGVAERRAGLERTREAVAAVAVVPDTHRGFVARVQQFPGIGG